MPQLNGLRCLAVVAVMVQHWGGNKISFSGFPIGSFGVGLFFTLSGYLITGILLNLKAKATSSLKQCLRIFWIRRVIRIFPIFYVALLLGYLFKIEGLSNYWPWHLSYLSNILVFKGLNTGYATHFWTLAIEEQFYLIWPLLILILPDRTIFKVSMLLILLSILWQSGFILPTYKTKWALIPGQLDSLSFGSLLAYLERHNTQMAIEKLSKYAFLFGIALFYFCI